MKPSRRQLYSQNFLYSRKLINSLVDQTDIGPRDHVIEIGSGHGLTTQALAKRARQVTALEIDPYWVEHAANVLKKYANITVLNQDVLTYQFPRSAYKVWSNTPFAIESRIVTKLLDSPNPPRSCALILMDQYAKRLCESKATLLTLRYYPWFTLTKIRPITKTAFRPVPTVDATYISIVKRTTPLIDATQKNAYRRFIEHGFGQGDKIFTNLKKQYPEKVLRSAFHQLSISRKAKPGGFSKAQWLEMYQQLQ